MDACVVEAAVGCAASVGWVCVATVGAGVAAAGAQAASSKAAGRRRLNLAKVMGFSLFDFKKEALGCASLLVVLGRHAAGGPVEAGILSPADQLVGLLIPQVQEDALEAGQQGDGLHILEGGVLVMGALQVVVGNARRQVVQVVEADVAREPLQKARQLGSTRRLPGRCSGSPTPRAAASKRLRTGAARRRDTRQSWRRRP